MMHKDLEEYVNNRILELSRHKNKILDWLQTANKPINELNINEKKNLQEMKQKFFSYYRSVGRIRRIKKGV